MSSRLRMQHGEPVPDERIHAKAKPLDHTEDFSNNPEERCGCRQTEGPSTPSGRHGDADFGRDDNSRRVLQEVNRARPLLAFGDHCCAAGIHQRKIADTHFLAVFLYRRFCSGIVRVVVVVEENGSSFAQTRIKELQAVVDRLI